MKIATRKSEWFERPQATARMARKIWDLVTERAGREPYRLWKNWNGIVFGKYAQSGADYGRWMVEFSKYGQMGGVPEDILEIVRGK